MSEVLKRILTTIVLVSIIIILFMYGTNLSFVLAIYLLTILSFYEWLQLTSKPRYFISPFIILLVLLDLTRLIDIYSFLFFFLIILLIMISLTFNYESFLRIKNQTIFNDYWCIHFFIIFPIPY